MMDGLFVNGPLLHYAYDILERYMPAGESVLGAVMQVCDGTKNFLYSTLYLAACNLYVFFCFDLFR